MEQRRPGPFRRTTARPTIDINAFAYPGEFRLGNAGRNILTGPRLVWAQVSAQKNFRFKETLQRPAPLGYPERPEELQLQGPWHYRGFPQSADLRQAPRRSAHCFTRRPATDEHYPGDTVLSTRQRTLREGLLSGGPLFSALLLLCRSHRDKQLFGRRAQAGFGDWAAMLRCSLGGCDMPFCDQQFAQLQVCFVQASDTQRSRTGIRVWLNSYPPSSAKAWRGWRAGPRSPIRGSADRAARPPGPLRLKVVFCLRQVALACEQAGKAHVECAPLPAASGLPRPMKPERAECLRFAPGRCQDCGDSPPCRDQSQWHVRKARSLRGTAFARSTRQPVRSVQPLQPAPYSRARSKY